MSAFLNSFITTRIGIISSLLFIVCALMIARSLYMLLYRGFYFKYTKGKPYIRGTIGNNIFLGCFFAVLLVISSTGLLLAYGFSGTNEFEGTEKLGTISVQRISNNEFVISLKTLNRSFSQQVKGTAWHLNGTTVVWHPKLKFVGLGKYNLVRSITSGSNNVLITENKIIDFLSDFSDTVPLCSVRQVRTPLTKASKADFDLLISEAGYVLRKKL